MQTQAPTFDQLPGAVYELSRKVDYLTTLLASRPADAPTLSADTSDLLTIKQASDLLNLAVPTIYSMVGRKILPFHKPAGTKKLVFSKKQLTDWVLAGRQKTVAELQAEVKTNAKSRKG